MGRPPLNPAARSARQVLPPLPPEKPRPYMEYFPLKDKKIDYFPDIDPGDDGHLQALKDGTYAPLMQLARYTTHLISTGEGYKLHNLVDPSHASHGRRFASEIDVGAGPGTTFYDYTRELSRIYKKNQWPLQRRYYANPRQYYDNILLADAWTNSFAGLVLDTKVDYVFPRAVHPVLKLRGPTGDAAEDARIIEKHKYLIDKLEAIDAWYTGLGPDPGPQAMTPVPVQDKLKTAFRMSQVFGRGIVAQETWKAIPPVTIFPRNKNGKRTKSTNGEYKKAQEIKGLPNVLKVVHPMYAGLTELDLMTGEVAGVWVADNQTYIPASRMMYFLNGFQTPQPGSEGYGESAIQRALDHVRLYRRLLAVNFPQFLRTSASGMGVFVVNTTGYAQEERERIRTNLRESYSAAELGVLDVGNVDEFKFEEFKINTDIDALVKMEQSLLGSISTVMDMPHSILMDSNESKATLIGRVLTFLEIKVVNWRAQLGRQIAAQYYMPNFRALCAAEGDKSLLEEFYVDVRFEEVSLETKQEKIDRLLLETQLNPYTDAWIGEQLGDPDYEQHVDQKKLEEQKKQEQMEMSIQVQRARGSGGSEGRPFKDGSRGRNPARRARSKNGSSVSTKDSGPKRGTAAGR